MKDLSGFLIGGHTIRNLRYANVTVLVAESQEKLQELLDEVEHESKQKGLSIMCKKAKCMVVGQRENTQCE